MHSIPSTYFGSLLAFPFPSTLPYSFSFFLSCLLGISFGCWVGERRVARKKGEVAAKTERNPAGFGKRPIEGWKRVPRRGRGAGGRDRANPAGEGGRVAGPHGTGNDGWLSDTCLRCLPCQTQPRVLGQTWPLTYSPGAPLGLVRDKVSY